MVGGKSPVSEGVCLLTAVQEQLEKKQKLGLPKKAVVITQLLQQVSGKNVWTAVDGSLNQFFNFSLL